MLMAGDIATTNAEHPATATIRHAHRDPLAQRPSRRTPTDTIGL
jgi:hypothetical protein